MGLYLRRDAGYGPILLILGLVLAADIYLCDPHGLCSWQHDWVGLGDKPWPTDKDQKKVQKDNYPGWWGHERAAHKRCKLGDQNWRGDCN
jgi:hypothetical protein